MSQALIRPNRTAVAIAVVLCTATLAGADAFVRVEMNLTAGSLGNTFYLQLYDDRPLTRDNFLNYVNSDRYNGSFFHRLAHDFVLQGGGFYVSDQSAVDLDGDPLTPNPTVPNEFSNPPARSNVRSTIAMAKLGGDPDSATNQWFINLGDNSSNLDFQNGGFAVFGRVIKGMDYVDVLASVQTYDLDPAPATLFDDVPLANISGQFYYEVMIDVSEVQTPFAYGDLDLDGVVSFTEAATVVANQGLQNAAWDSGDFDGDWTVTLADAEAAVAAYNLQNPTAMVTVEQMLALPEPASLALLGLGLLGLGRRRRTADL